MNDRNRHRFEDEAAVAAALRELPCVDARPGFRAELRERFVSGAILALVKETEPDRAPARWFRPIALAASVALLVAAVWTISVLNRGPATRVFASVGEGQVRIGGLSLPLTDHAAIEAALAPEVEIILPAGAQLDLEIPGVAVYELAGGSRLTLPESPGRWFGRAAACSLTSGEIRFRSLPDFEGAKLAVFTPDGQVRVTGTLFSVQCDEEGTCVCVLEGTVRVGVDEADLELVEPGSRKVMPRSGDPKIVPVKPMHRDGVLDFDERARQQMESAP